MSIYQEEDKPVMKKFQESQENRSTSEESS